MNTFEIIRLFQNFERYDKYTRDYAAHDTKAQRFNDYLSKMKCVIEELQQILEYNNIGLSGNNISINEHEIKRLNTATTFYFKLEKRITAAAPA